MCQSISRYCVFDRPNSQQTWCYECQAEEGVVTVQGTLKVWVVTVEQLYANSFRVVGVFTSEEKANEEASKHPDTQIENYLLDIAD